MSPVEITTTGSFEAFDLRAETLASLDAKGYRAPTPCQAEAIPLAMKGHDLVVQSPGSQGSEIGNRILYPQGR